MHFSSGLLEKLLWKVMPQVPVTSWLVQLLLEELLLLKVVGQAVYRYLFRDVLQFLYFLILFDVINIGEELY